MQAVWTCVRVCLCVRERRRQRGRRARACDRAASKLDAARSSSVRGGGHSLLTMAVGRMEAMAACCGRSWMLSSSLAGYMPSLRDMWFTACSRESKSTANATSSSPSIMFLVVVHHSWPPAQNRDRGETFNRPPREEGEKKKGKGWRVGGGLRTSGEALNVRALCNIWKCVCVRLGGHKQHFEDLE